MQKLKLQIDQNCSAESSDVILLFCPVVSRIGTDMEAAMARVTEDKPVILVFMHHCHNPSHMTNITVQPSRRNIEQVVHCAFHETKGLLECQENEQAVKAVRSTLLRCVDSQDAVPQLTKSQSEEKQPLLAFQDSYGPNITNNSKLSGNGTDPASKESESEQRTIVSAMEHSTGPSEGKGCLGASLNSTCRQTLDTPACGQVAMSTVCTKIDIPSSVDLRIDVTGD
nr:uncharacterized protein LOC111834253 [Paramormyrops kingsleyae]